MDRYYDKIKDDVAFRDDLDESGIDKINDDAFKQLRPYNPYSFKELISDQCFSPDKFIHHQREKDRLSGGFGNSIVFKDKS